MDAIAALKAHLAKAQYQDQLSTLDDVARFVRQCYPSLTVESVCINDDAGCDRWVIVCSAKYTRVEGGNIGPVKQARMVFDDRGDYTFEVLLKTIRSGSWKESQPPHEGIVALLDTLLASSGYVICPGIIDYQSEFGEVIRFQSKNLRVWTNPIARHDSTECLMWHKPSNLRVSSSNQLFNVCSSCKSLHHHLSVIKNRNLEASPGHKEKWIEPSSNRPLKYLSPASQSQRLQKNTQERKRLRKALLKYVDPLDIELSGEQDDELLKLPRSTQKS